MKIRNIVLIFVTIFSGLVHAAGRDIRVVDATSGAPIGGAMVVEAVLGKNMHTKRTECITLQSVVTDQKGTFKAMSSNGMLINKKYTNVFTSSLVYKSGFIRDHNKAVANRDEIHLKSDRFPIDMRLKYLFSLIVNSECPNSSNRKNILMPYFKAIYKEAEKLSYASGDGHELQLMKRRIASAWSPANVRNPAELDRIFNQKVEKILK